MSKNVNYASLFKSTDDKRKVILNEFSILNEKDYIPICEYMLMFDNLFKDDTPNNYIKSIKMNKDKFNSYILTLNSKINDDECIDEYINECNQYVDECNEYIDEQYDTYDGYNSYDKLDSDTEYDSDKYDSDEYDSDEYDYDYNESDYD